MKSLLDALISVLQDCGAVCGADPSRDCITVTRRTEHEGESFLTICLPTFSECFESALRDGFWSPSQLTAFKRCKSRCLPSFLKGFTDQIFSSNGLLLDDPSVDAIRAVRQVCRFANKVFTVCSDARKKVSERHFVQVEEEIRRHVIPKDLLEIFEKVSNIVWSGIVGDPSDVGSYQQLRPRHGPGTTCEGITGNAKYSFAEWPSRLETEFPYTEFGCANILNPDAEASLSRLVFLHPRDERPVKVALVPKTAKKARVIAIEPVAMQYMQQALSDWLRPRIETRNRYTSGHVNFTDQSVNANLARIGSKNGFYATLDLSDASDRVSCLHVSHMLKGNPTLSRWFFSCRSTRAKLPSGLVLPLRKFASMGSATCFPVEAMVFFVAIVSMRLLSRQLRPSPARVFKYSRAVYVYGDDLVVPAEEAPAIISGLEAFGLKVNSAKSFWTGKFRESCGRDYYDGVDVTPVYIRREVPCDRADVHGLVGWVATANQLYWVGLWKTARLIREHIEKILGVLPAVPMGSQVLGWNSFSNAVSFHSWHKDFQRPRMRGWVPCAKRRVDVIDGDSALLKCYRTIGSYVLPASDHLSTSVRYGNLALKRRWI